MQRYLCGFQVVSCGKVQREFALQLVDGSTALSDVFAEIYGNCCLASGASSASVVVSVYTHDSPHREAVYVELPIATLIQEARQFGKWFKFDVRDPFLEDEKGPPSGSTSHCPQAEHGTGTHADGNKAVEALPHIGGETAQQSRSHLEELTEQLPRVPQQMILSTKQEPAEVGFSGSIVPIHSGFRDVQEGCSGANIHQSPFVSMPPAIMGTRPKKRSKNLVLLPVPKKRTTSGGATTESDAEGYIPQPSSPCGFAAAQRAAVEMSRRLKNPSIVKVVTSCQMSGCYRVCIPPEFGNRFITFGRKTLKIEHGDCSWDVEIYARKSHKPNCPSIHHSLAGGWRTFAQSQKLKMNDVMVFEYLSAERMKVYISRASETTRENTNEGSSNKEEKEESVLQKEESSGPVVRVRSATAEYSTKGKDLTPYLCLFSKAAFLQYRMDSL